MSYEYEFDIYYGTGYEGGPYTGSDAMPADGFSYEKYYMLLNSFAEVGYTCEILGLYKWTYRAWAEPWTFHPLEFWLIWYRPIASDWDFSTFDLNVYISSHVNALNFYQTWEEHLKVAQKSIADFVMDFANYTPIPSSADDWKFYDAQSDEYEDPYFQIDIVEKFIPGWYNSDYYGEIALFNWWIFDNYSW